MLKYTQAVFRDLRAKIEPGSFLFLLLLLGADLTFVVIHFFYKFTHNMECSLFCLTTERGYAEIFQYIKYFWIIILFIDILRKSRNTGYISWILVFTFFFCDDAFQLHSKIGYMISRSFNFDPPFHLRLWDIGELAYFVMIGVAFLGLLIWTYMRGNLTFRKISIDILILVLVIVFFGVVVDITHVAFSLYGVGMSIIEDTGEMIMSSLILWYVFTLALENDSFYIDIPLMVRKLFSKT